jgi:hypothetical protein
MENGGVADIEQSPNAQKLVPGGETDPGGAMADFVPVPQDFVDDAPRNDDQGTLRYVMLKLLNTMSLISLFSMHPHIPYFQPRPFSQNRVARVGCIPT